MIICSSAIKLNFGIFISCNLFLIHYIWEASMYFLLYYYFFASYSL